MLKGWRSGGSALVLLALALAACGGGSSKSDDASSTAPAAVVSSSPGTTVARKPGQLSGPLLVSPPTVAPQIVLHDQNGKLFKLSSLRGKAVFLTFVYAHCPDVCPLMMQGLGGGAALAARSLDHEDHRRLRRSQGRHAEGGQGVPALASS